MKSTPIALILLLAGCGPPWRFAVRSEQPRTIQPAEGKALLVFMNAGKLGGGDVYYLIDQNKRFLGETIMASRILVDVDPGKHTFYAVNKGDGSKVEAELTAGKTYFIKVRIGFGGGVELVAFSPRSDEWVHREEWLSSRTSEVTADPAAGQAFIDKYSGWVEKNMARADERVNEMTPEAKAKVAVLNADDGI
jgi:hypothetical protein